MHTAPCVLEVSSTSLASKASYCSEGAPQKGKSELCSNVVITGAYGSLRFSAIFSASPLFILVPSHHLLWRQGDWMDTSQCQSLFGCTYLSLFHVVGRSVWGIYWNKTEVGYVILMSKNIFSQLFHSPRRNIQPCIVTCIAFSFEIVFVDWQKCGFCLNISTELSHDLCLRVLDLCLIEL